MMSSDLTFFYFFISMWLQSLVSIMSKSNSCLRLFYSMTINVALESLHEQRLDTLTLEKVSDCCP